MRCYFLRDRRVAGVEELPSGLSDEEAVAKAHAMSAKRKGTFDSLEVWEGGRFVFRGPLSVEERRGAASQPTTSRPRAAE